MPVFEYRCKTCETKFEVLHKSSNNNDKVHCPKCESSDNKKLFSSFSASVESSGYSESSCSDGSCATAPSVGGCSTGMCGLN